MRTPFAAKKCVFSGQYTDQKKVLNKHLQFFGTIQYLILNAFLLIFSLNIGTCSNYCCIDEAQDAIQHSLVEKPVA